MSELRFKLKMSFNYIIIPENVVSERIIIALKGMEMKVPNGQCTC